MIEPFDVLMAIGLCCFVAHLMLSVGATSYLIYLMVSDHKVSKQLHKEYLEKIKKLERSLALRDLED